MADEIQAGCGDASSIIDERQNPNVIPENIGTHGVVTQHEDTAESTLESLAVSLDLSGQDEVQCDDEQDSQMVNQAVNNDTIPSVNTGHESLRCDYRYDYTVVPNKQEINTTSAETSNKLEDDELNLRAGVPQERLPQVDVAPQDIDITFGASGETPSDPTSVFSNATEKKLSGDVVCDTETKEVEKESTDGKYVGVPRIDGESYTTAAANDVQTLVSNTDGGAENAEVPFSPATSMCNGLATSPEVQPMERTDPFYTNAADYWGTVPPNIEGMLGGFGHISSTDVGSSFKFLRSFIIGERAKTETRKALDCGAGIGRITKLLLTTVFDSVDLLEQNPKFVQESPAYLGKEKAAKVEQFICSGLQSFTPKPNKYDVIWIQWVMGHLTDDDFIAFLQRCQKGLKANGIIVVKENISFSDEPEFDEKDSSYTRPRETIMQLFERSGLDLLKEEKQKHFPKELYEVRMFALQ